MDIFWQEGVCHGVCPENLTCLSIQINAPENCDCNDLIGLVWRLYFGYKSLAGLLELAKKSQSRWQTCLCIDWLFSISWKSIWGVQWYFIAGRLGVRIIIPSGNRPFKYTHFRGISFGHTDVWERRFFSIHWPAAGPPELGQHTQGLLGQWVAQAGCLFGFGLRNGRLSYQSGEFLNGIAIYIFFL